jgi:GTPase SAR1 family protein
MGNKSSTPEDRELDRKTREIEAAMARNKDIDTKKVKLLLLGAGECGKSTIFKQMRLIYGEKFSQTERESKAFPIYGNILAAVKTLLEQAELLECGDLIQAHTEATLLNGIDNLESMTVQIGDAVRTLWADPGLQEIWSRRSEYQIIESVQYYFNKIDEIKLSTYVPTDNDILHLRVRTSGIVTESYAVEKLTYEVYDVGGQRNERKKWIHCFNNVTAVIFVVGMSEYDQALLEDESANRMVEALELFDDICNNAYFLKSALILFMNKKDLFLDKIKVKKIADQEPFSDFTGGSSFDAGISYFLKKFLALNKSSSRKIYHHVTCATDTSSVKIVLNSCNEIIVTENLKKSGLVFD